MNHLTDPQTNENEKKRTRFSERKKSLTFKTPKFPSYRESNAACTETTHEVNSAIKMLETFFLSPSPNIIFLIIPRESSQKIAGRWTQSSLFHPRKKHEERSAEPPRRTSLSRPFSN